MEMKKSTFQINVFFCKHEANAQKTSYYLNDNYRLKSYNLVSLASVKQVSGACVRKWNSGNWLSFILIHTIVTLQKYLNRNGPDWEVFININ